MDQCGGNRLDSFITDDTCNNTDVILVPVHPLLENATNNRMLDTQIATYTKDLSRASLTCLQSLAIKRVILLW